MSKRQQLKEQRRRQSMISNFMWGAVVVILVAIVGYIIWSSISAPAAATSTATPASAASDLSTPSTTLIGEAVPIGPTDRNHIDKDTDPGPYSSDPPTSGHHYPIWLDAGFYD